MRPSNQNRVSNPVSEAAERIRQERRQETIRPLRPERDLTWERMESTEDDFAREIDNDHDYY